MNSKIKCAVDIKLNKGKRKEKKCEKSMVDILQYAMMKIVLTDCVTNSM